MALAALCMNGRFSSSAVVPNFTLLQQIGRSARAQREISRERLGSALPLSVSNDHDRFEMTNGFCRSSGSLDVDPFSDTQGVFQFDPQITDCAIDLGVAKQKLNGPQVTSLSIDFRHFSSTHGMSAIAAGFQPN